LSASFDYIQIYNNNSNTLERKVRKHVTQRFDVESELEMTTNKSVGRSNAPQETATDCGYGGLQAIASTVELFAYKYIALNHE